MSVSWKTQETQIANLRADAERQRSAAATAAKKRFGIRWTGSGDLGTPPARLVPPPLGTRATHYRWPSCLLRGTEAGAIFSFSGPSLRRGAGEPRNEREGGSHFSPGRITRYQAGPKQGQDSAQHGLKRFHPRRPAGPCRRAAVLGTAASAPTDQSSSHGRNYSRGTSTHSSPSCRTAVIQTSSDTSATAAKTANGRPANQRTAKFRAPGTALG